MSTPEQPRDRHIRRGDGAGFHPTTPPTDTRPYRRASEPSGNEMRTRTINAQQTWRQIGWHGQTGAFYSLDEKPSEHEGGSWSPLWVLVDNEPTDAPVIPDQHAELLKRAEQYLAATHEHTARHDVLGENLSCAGCDLLSRIRTALDTTGATP